MVKDLGNEAVKRTTSTRVCTMNKSIASILVLFLLTTLFRQNAFLYNITEASATTDLSKISLNQTADIKVVFLGIPPEYVDVNGFAESVSKSVSQFAPPNTMTWTLNVSILFHEFPENALDSLDNNAYRSKGITYYNITLLDFLLSQLENLTIPERGYLIVFMWVPDNPTNHSWFYVQERPDLFLGRTDYNGMPFEYWAFPTGFGGIRRALYFDVSDITEQTSSKLLVTSRAVSLFNNGLTDIFNPLLGSEDPRMIAADVQRYENYQVRIIWLNGTEEQFYPERINEAFEDLMPWTNWTVTIETRAIDDALAQLIENRTEELSKPVTYSFLLSNGSSVTIEASRNVKCEFFADSGEQDPLIRYFFENVKNWNELAKYFIHGFAFSLLFTILTIAWAFLLLVLVALGFIIGLIVGLGFLMLIVGFANAIITTQLWFPIKAGFLDLVLHGLVMFIALLFVNGIFILGPSLMFPGIATTVVTFIIAAFVDGFVGKQIAGFWSDLREESVEEMAERKHREQTQHP